MEEQILKPKLILAGLLPLMMILLPGTLLANGIQSTTVIISQTQNHTLSQLSDQPIIIGDDSDFVSLGATGVGTRADPYVIQDLVISTRNTCISVMDTTSFFIISRCILTSDDLNPVILFSNVENGQILQCDITDGESGVQFLQTTDCSIIDTDIYDCWIGIEMNQATNCTVATSRIFNNHRGLFFENADFIRTENNTIYSNTKNGLEFSWFTNNNTVLGNEFGWNGASGQTEENAVDHGNDNHFDDGVDRGNAWSDFNGTTPYAVLGTSGINDSYPVLLEDTTSPFISDLPNTVIDVETNGNMLTWSTIEQYPQRYTVYIDENPVVSAVWSGGGITVSLDSQPLGTYIYRVTVFDGGGNYASDVVYVTVVSFVLGGIGTELVMIASGITVAIFLVIILLIKKMS